ncbi:peptidylprolyl isomerase fpr4 [Mortierella polycephala]|uniref:peptidylprolyl isomerase n=1 Tax=Mortierella polycephala TaxID=41804 RepID=A0A9P6U574_9FUNG|nr:peptidylprolyl isomerase fpr4 [Mortierella polycephala]
MLGFWGAYTLPRSFSERNMPVYIGLTVLPEKTYSQVVENSFKLSMAALDETTKPGRSSVRVTVDKKTFVLCSLIPGKVEQQTLDLVFTEGEEITFSVSGVNSIHLSGNYLPEDDGMDYDSDEEDIYGDMDEDEDEEGDEEDEEDEEEQEDNVIVTKGAKRVAQQAAVPEKKQKVTEEKAVPVKKEAAKKEAAAKKEVKKEQPKKEVKKEEAKKEQPKKEPKKEEPKKDNKKVLANGMVIEDVKVGTGAAAKSGKKIGMRYIGRLTNGKVFDKNTSGKPFNFNLGRGEVIKGWDLGIQGMMLGGERRLTIPPALAYGAQGAPPDIPRNATLVFEVKLVTLK